MDFGREDSETAFRAHVRPRLGEAARLPELTGAEVDDAVGAGELVGLGVELGLGDLDPEVTGAAPDLEYESCQRDAAAGPAPAGPTTSPCRSGSAPPACPA